MSQSSNETTYRLQSLFSPKQKNDLKRPKIENENLEINAKTVEKMLEIVNNDEMRNMPDCLAKALLEEKSETTDFKVDVDTAHDSLYVAGRYLKYSRSLPQTPWIMNGKRHFSETSVEELISGPINALFLNSKSILTSSGREDVDVRCLGNGRPFIIEVQRPRALPNESELTESAKKFNESCHDVNITDVCLVGRDATKLLLDGEMAKTKSYRAYCYAQAELSEADLRKLTLNELELKQKTPVRVLHRRNNDTRPRTVHSCEGKRWDGKAENWFYIDLETQAGTYVKEFVHGDFGRTSPSVRDILNIETDIVGLDVMGVKMVWPPEKA